MYYNNRQTTKTEPDVDPADFLIPCEQTMIEGDTEILNPSDTDDSAVTQNKAQPVCYTQLIVPK